MSKLVRLLRRNCRYGEKGFTLIELLVVVAILGILAAVVVPNVGSFIGEGKEEAMATELHDVQLAMTAVMATAQISTVDAQTTWVGDLTGFPTVGSAAITYDDDGDPATAEVTVSFEDYLITPDTEYFYQWEADGTVLQDEDGV